MQNDPEFAVWLEQVTTDPELARLRCDTIARVAPNLDAVGISLQKAGIAAGRGKPPNLRPREEGSGAVFAVGELARIAAELAGASGEMFCGKRHYAAAALLRQIVEIEYLTWAFATGQRGAVDWLNSTSDERWSYFRPAKLRKLGGGRFNDQDYKFHCEQGGHPVPGAGGLIGGSNPQAAQILLVDLLLHCWRIADALRYWVLLPDNDLVEVPDPLRAANQILNVWGEHDPYYEFMCLIEPGTETDAR